MTKKTISKLLIFAMCSTVFAHAVSPVGSSANERITEKKNNLVTKLSSYSEWSDAGVYDGSFSTAGTFFNLVSVISGIAGFFYAPAGVISIASGIIGSNMEPTVYYRKVTQFKIKDGVMYKRYKTTFYRDSGHYEQIGGTVYSDAYRVRNGFSVDRSERE